MEDCNKCKRLRKIENWKIIDGTMLAVMTQHKGFDKKDEIICYNDLVLAHSGKWILIRFNLGKYIDSTGKRKDPDIQIRLPRLLEEMDKQISRIHKKENVSLFEMSKLYFNGYESN